ncbi:MAG TPA: alpha/beta hydrolase [Ktedonobacteraceae bacterium]|nr:alpha/beta hydrolase [Ktedonobacteraceae bacterium]
MNHFFSPRSIPRRKRGIAANDSDSDPKTLRKTPSVNKERAENLLVFGAFVMLATAFVGGFGFYRSWQRKELTRIRKDSSIVKTAFGPVEYQVTGKGPVVLYAHGTPGGYDQGIAFAQFLRGCTVLSPSRPGYLRTPLAAGPAPEEQADLYAALLDELGIQQASIIGFSGGGPSALQFALRYPDRCRSLVMIGGIVQRNGKHERQQALPFWRRLLSQITDRLLVSDPFLYFALPFTRFIPAGSAVAGMLCSGALYPLRKAGHENDLIQFASLEHMPLEQITAPTLVVHGTTDDEVPFDDAMLLASKLPHVTLLAIEGGDHAAFYTSARTVMPMVRDFLS